MTADFITIKRNEGGIESLDFQNNAFIVSEVDSTRYNQIKGKNMKDGKPPWTEDTVSISYEAKRLHELREEARRNGIPLEHLKYMDLEVPRQSRTNVPYLRLVEDEESRDNFEYEMSQYKKRWKTRDYYLFWVGAVVGTALAMGLVIGVVIELATS